MKVRLILLIAGIIGIGCESNNTTTELKNQNAKLKLDLQQEKNHSESVEREHQKTLKEITDLMNFVEDITLLLHELEKKLAEINIEEDQIEGSLSGENAPNLNDYSLKGRMLDKINDIANRLESNEQTIDSLYNILNHSAFKIDGLDSLVARQKSKLVYKQVEIDSLKEKVNSLKREAEGWQRKALQVYDMEERLRLKEQELDKRERELRESEQQRFAEQNQKEKYREQVIKKFYIVKKEAALIDFKIIKKVKKSLMAEGKLDAKYFETIIFQDNQVLLLGGSAEEYQLVSIHPDYSYKFYDRNGQKHIEIVDANEFWKVTPYLIIAIK